LLLHAGSILTFLPLPKVTLPLLLTDITPEVSIGAPPPPVLLASTSSSILPTTWFHSWASKLSPVFLA